MKIKLSIAKKSDFKNIFNLRHEVYADELKQYPKNEKKTLSDTKGIDSTYIVAKDFNDLVKTKLALFESISNSNGMLFLNKDDLHITNNYDKKSNKIISYSINDVNSDFVGDLSEVNQGIVSINNNLFNVPYRTNVFAFNFLASYSIASTFGVRSASIQNALDQFFKSVA